MSDIGLKIGIDGEKDFKNSIREINQSFKVLGSEMQLVTSQFDKNDKSISALTSRNAVLDKSISSQKDKIETLKSALDNATKSFGENDKRTQNWQIQLNKAQAELNGMERELKDNVKALADVERGTNDAGDKLDEFGAVVKKTGDDTGESVNKFEKLGEVLASVGKAVVATAVAVGTAAAAVGVGMFKMAENAAATGKEVNNMSQKLGLSREGFQEWEFILRKSGTSIDIMGTGMKTLQKTLGGLTEDGDSASKAFKAIGISFDEIKGKTPEEALNMTIKALQDLPPGADRTASALKLFGKGAMELQPLLNKTSADTEELRQRAHDLGLVMDGDAVDAAGKFNGAMGRAKDTIAGMKLQISSALLPAFADGLSAFLDFAQGADGGEEKMKSAVDNMVQAITVAIPQMVDEGAKMISNLVTGISQALPGVVGAISDALPLIVGAITTMAPQLVEVIMGAVPMVVSAILSALPVLADAAVQIVLALVDGLSGMLPQLIPVAIEAIQSIATGLIQNVNLLLEAALQLILALADGILEALPELIAALPPIITAIVGFIIEAIPQLIEAGVQLLIALVKNTPAIIVEIVKAIPMIIAGIVGAFKQAGPKIVEVGSDLLRGVWEGIKNTGDWLWKQISGFFGNLIGKVKNFLGIHSPSQLFAEIGGNMGQGVGVGFVSAIEAVGGQMKDALGDVMSSINLDKSIMIAAQPVQQPFSGAGTAAQSEGRTINQNIIQNIYAENTSYADQQREAARRIELVARGLTA